MIREEGGAIDATSPGRPPFHWRSRRWRATLQAEEACTLIEFLDQLPDMLLETYGDDITAWLQQHSSEPPQQGEPLDWLDDGEPF